MKLYDQYKQIVTLILVAGLMIIVAFRFSDLIGILDRIFNALIPLLIGIVLAFILDILVKKYEKFWFPRKKTGFLKKSRRPVAIFLSLLTVIAVIAFIGRMAIPQLVHSLGIIVNALPYLYQDVSNWIRDNLSTISLGSNMTIGESINSNDVIEQVRSWGTQGGRYLVSTMGSAVSGLTNFAMGFIFAIYILLSKEDLKRQFTKLFRAYLPDLWVARTSHFVQVGTQTFSNFFVGQFLDALILGVMVGIGLHIFGVSYANTIACVIAMTALVPMVGAYVGGLMGLIMLLTVSPLQALIYLIVLLVMQQIEGNLIYPRIVGSSVGLPGIWVFGAVVIGGSLFGIIGMLLGVPLMGTIYKLLREDVHKRIREHSGF